ncbi:MAG: PD-(D/E)XK nuclease family protein [Pseudomonadota bacterium]
MVARLDPLTQALSDETAALETILAAHEQAATALSTAADAEQPELFKREAGETLQRLLWRTSRAAEGFGAIETADYPLLLKQLMAGESVREPFGQHARVAILGTLEARMLSAEVVVAAGLNEGVWPKPEEPDPWVSRDMRAALGLPPLESRIGLSAHDFLQAAMAREVVLTRTRKADGAPTVASRWLLRLTTLLEGLAPEPLGEMRARGARWLALAGRLDPLDALNAAARRPAERPAPRPPIEARPRALSVTDVETLIRDPYALYAKRTLRLRALPALDERPDARDRGEILHAIMEDFSRRTADGDWPPEDPSGLYDAVVETALAPIRNWPMLHAFWRTRARQIRDWHLDQEAARRAAGRPTALEATGKLPVETALGTVTLTGKADRIDRKDDGTFALYDYKTGAPPSERQVAHFAKQLPLEAAMLARTAFDDPVGGASAGPGPVSEVAYVSLTGGSGGGTVKRLFEGEEAEAADAALDGLAKLCSAYADPGLAYRSRTRPESLRYAGDYDHLARVGEWADGVDAPSDADGALRARGGAA